ncbi:hypothetical protein [Kitasatospora sp. NPDC092286]|uniref:hypothetical protein n=1 Tax=Kitasatospora sp. NPDC092286 TaxID=3364087 RepID=UPI00382A7259
MPTDIFGEAVPKGERSPRKSSRDKDAVTRDDWIAAVAAHPAVYELARLISPHTPKNVGRPGHYPPYVYVIFNALTMVFGSARSTAAHLQCGEIWGRVREGVAANLGKQEADALPACGPTRHHWLYNRTRLLLPRLADLLEAHRALAVRQAEAQGLLDPGAPKNWSNPMRQQLIVGDGTVVKAPTAATAAETVDTTTGEIKRHRFDPGSGLHAESGDKTMVWGPKFVLFSARGDDYRDRVILEARHQPAGQEGGEARVALDGLRELFREARGALGTVWDGAFRGVHRDEIARQGKLVVNKQHGTCGPRRLVPYLGSKCRHDLWAVDGRVAERRTTEDGTSENIQLPVVKLEQRPSVNDCRWYHLLRIPCRHGDHKVRIRVATNASDEDLGQINRPEWLRQIPPGTRAFQKLAGYRADAESTNASLDRRLWNGRMIAYGAPRQTLVMLGFVMAENAASRALHRRRSGSSAG